MNKLQILMPMGGLGSRFAKAGFTTPKPLIKVDGMPMFRKALTSLDDLSVPKEFLFVIRQEHADTLKLDQLIAGALPEAKVIVIPELTRGAVETAVAAKDYLDQTQPLVVMDCDLWFSSESYNQMILKAINKTVPSAGLLTFTSNNPRYSYAKVDGSDNVTETAEKVVISNHAITGAYFFSTAELFINSAIELLGQPLTDTMPEYYLSYLYNILLDHEITVKATYVDDYASFGTPEELEEYNDGN